MTLYIKDHLCTTNDVEASCGKAEGHVRVRPRAPIGGNYWTCSSL